MDARRSREPRATWPTPAGSACSTRGSSPLSTPTRASESIDGTAALSIPGVVAVLAAGDLPIVGTGPQRRFEPLARDEVVYAGQPVALVVAESEAAAEDGVELVLVDLEPLAPVVDLLAAMDEDAPLMRTSRTLMGPERPPLQAIGTPVSKASRRTSSAACGTSGATWTPPSHEPT